MKSKKIANIVFYKFNNGGEESRQACIFYTDGTIANATYQEGINACEEIAKELHITSKDAFQQMINKELIHVMTGSELERKFNSFIVAESQNEESKDEEISPSFKAVEGLGNDDEENISEAVEEDSMESSNTSESQEVEEDFEDEDRLDEDFVNQLDEENTSMHIIHIGIISSRE